MGKLEKPRPSTYLDAGGIRWVVVTRVGVTFGTGKGRTGAVYPRNRRTRIARGDRVLHGGGTLCDGFEKGKPEPISDDQRKIQGMGEPTDQALEWLRRSRHAAF